MLRTVKKILVNVNMIIYKGENRITYSHWIDVKSGNLEKVGRMAPLYYIWDDSITSGGSIYRKDRFESIPEEKLGPK